MVPKEDQPECIVIFDEAHNIDDQCVEAYKIELNRPLLENATRNVDTLKKKMDEIKEMDKNKLEEEYNKLLKGMTEKGVITEDMKIEETATEMIKGNNFKTF
jgi:DNA excision repair protein ERCC-2